MYQLLFFFLTSFFFFFSSSLLYVKGEDEICLYQILAAVKNRRVSSKMFWGMGYCWQPDQTYHFAIFALLLFFFFSFLFFPPSNMNTLLLRSFVTHFK